MIKRIRAFGAFWYDFVVGDDWRIAVAVVAALAVTIVLSHNAVNPWWVLPVLVALVLPWSLWRARRVPVPAREEAGER
ncbi:hypothetical protein [Amycolatopsis alkalitolerans]|uniref:Uncharacterized protein n=1 Tax=Amycolatopsis alkalitolerans TaxID=2547244 RepID=A0A5C4LTV4_9PSEU|nr:hypothetical protein [Amycolatopsis alkalitolerans]TNC21426.1 hypothetical protein FG385_28310 [Amycolatopsis alkalitolerans]